MVSGPMQYRIKYPDDACLWAVFDAALIEFDETYPRASIVQRMECVVALLQDLRLI
jgi:hypothetical protein